MKTILILAVLGAISYVIYAFFLKKKDVVPSSSTFVSPNPAGLNKEPDYMYKYAGETINREGKTYTWDRVLSKYVPVK